MKTAARQNDLGAQLHSLLEPDACEALAQRPQSFCCHRIDGIRLHADVAVGIGLKNLGDIDILTVNTARMRYAAGEIPQLIFFHVGGTKLLPSRSMAVIRAVP